MARVEQGKIISLNYHEISKDARVLKQARALRNAGYAVHVFCDWPNGMPENDIVDGVQVTRFHSSDMKGAKKSILEKLTFLSASRNEIERRFVPYASACETLEEMRPYLDAKFGANALERAQSSYFKQASGAERKRRAWEYVFLVLRMQFPYPFALRDMLDPVKRKYLSGVRSNLNLMRKLRHSLFQAESIVYCSNFPELSDDENIAAIHAHDIYCLPTGVMLSQRFGVPLIYDAHEYEPARASKMDAKSPELPKDLENDCFPFVTRIITVSDSIGDLYDERYDGPRPTIIMNAPEIDAGTLRNDDVSLEDGESVREKAGLGSDVPLIVFTGGIQGSHRGVDKVLEAMVSLPDAHFVSLGSRNRKDDDWIMGIARKLRVEERITLLPPVDARAVTAAISSATVSVAAIQDASLSYRYCLPNKLFEAAFARIPICVSDLPEMRRFVETLGIGKIMDQTDPASIAAALRDVFDNREDYLLTPESEAKLIDVYSWQAQTSKLLQLYQEIIGAPAAQQ